MQKTRWGPRTYDAAMVETGPRLPPLPAGEWDERLSRVLELSPGGIEEPMHIFATLGRADSKSSRSKLQPGEFHWRAGYEGFARRRVDRQVAELAHWRVGVRWLRAAWRRSIALTRATSSRGLNGLVR